MRLRWVTRPARNTTRRPHSPKMASSTSPIPGAYSTRSTSRRAMPAASSGAWTPSRSGSRPIGAPPSGAIWSSRLPTRQRASSPPIRTPAKSCGRRTSPKTWRNCRSPARFCRSRTRSSSARRAATAAFATGSLRLMPQLERSFGSNTRSRRRASRAARPGRTRTMPGRPAAAQYG